MSKLVKIFSGIALIVSVVAFAPGSAEARWHGGGWHGHGGWHGGWHRGWRGGGWGWGPAVGFGWGWGAPYAYYPGPYYGGDCGWVRVRVWRNGHRVLRRVWRCW
jgi:hypothetical protein